MNRSKRRACAVASSHVLISSWLFDIPGVVPLGKQQGGERDIVFDVTHAFTIARGEP